MREALSRRVKMVTKHRGRAHLLSSLANPVVMYMPPDAACRSQTIDRQSNSATLLFLDCTPLLDQPPDPRADRHQNHCKQLIVIDILHVVTVG